jgi:putative FmdB family regulatory protein
VPTYQYTCTECGEPLEAVQRIMDPPLTECPRCGGRLRKVFPAVGVVFKGSGFYRTDSRSAKAETSSGSNGDSSESAKTPAESANGSKTPAASTSASSPSSSSSSSSSGD